MLYVFLRNSKTTNSCLCFISALLISEDFTKCKNKQDIKSKININKDKNIQNLYIEIYIRNIYCIIFF